MKLRTKSLLSFLLFTTPLLAEKLDASTLRLKSPDGRIAIQVSDGGSLSYQASMDGKTVVSPSSMGISSDGLNLTTGTVFGTPSTNAIKESYPVMGGHAQATNRANEMTIPITGTNGESFSLDLHAANDGVAWRFRLPAKANRTITQETSTWMLPPDSMLWFQTDLGCYEGVFDGCLLQDVGKTYLKHSPAQKTTVALPITAALPGGGFALITEANLNDYADSAVEILPDHTIQMVMHAEPQGWQTSDKVVQPWRVTVLARDLTALVNTDLIRNLCPPPNEELAKADWIKPGRSTWQWLSSGGPKLDEQGRWVDDTRKAGFEYYLIDEGWKGWKLPMPSPSPTNDTSVASENTTNKSIPPKMDDSWAILSSVIVQAKKDAPDVGIWIWVNSKDIPNHETVVDFLDHAVSAGVVGVKIDFMPRASRSWANWYTDVLAEAAKRHLMVDFHGAAKPTGRDRTWPNEVNRESIRGHEYHVSRYNRVEPPQHGTILPFTRYVIGNADFTPTVFNPSELKGYSWAHELAQAVVYTAPFLCYGDDPKHYLENPAFDVMNEIPSTWDETIVLGASEIGERAAFARRKGSTWFIGVINGGKGTTVSLPLSFLEKGSYQASILADDPEKNDAWNRSEKNVSRKTTLEIPVRPQGGLVIRFKPVKP